MSSSAALAISSFTMFSLPRSQLESSSRAAADQGSSSSSSQANLSSKRDARPTLAFSRAQAAIAARATIRFISLHAGPQSQSKPLTTAVGWKHSRRAFTSAAAQEMWSQLMRR